MDYQRDPSYWLTEFLAGVRRSASAVCRAAGDGQTATKLELRFRHATEGAEHMLGLRAVLRDGVPVIELYEQSELGPAQPHAAP